MVATTKTTRGAGVLATLLNRTVIISLVPQILVLAGCLSPTTGHAVDQDSDSSAEADTDSSETATTCDKMMLDVLVVMGASASASHEQMVASHAVASFAEQLKNYDVDIHFAVTGSDAACDANASNFVHATKGQFSQLSASEYPPTGYIKQQQVCASDADCGAPDKWKCAAENLDACIENPNGSINTSCRRECETDVECVTEFGTGTRCLQPSGAPGDSGCILQPVTDACPAVTGPILDSTAIDQLTCLTRLGVHSAKCFKYDQHLKAAWMALDPKGALAAQSQAFLRPGARLAIVFITDEDDCSTAIDDSLSEDEYLSCAFLGDTDNGGPLIPVGDLADRYRSLKVDPSMVSVMAVAGDSLAVDLGDKTADREAFVSSTLAMGCHLKTYICEGQSGIADWGARYQALTEEFGANGLFKNVCDPAQQADAFTDLLDHLVAAHKTSCGR